MNMVGNDGVMSKTKKHTSFFPKKYTQKSLKDNKHAMTSISGQNLCQCPTPSDKDKDFNINKIRDTVPQVEDQSYIPSELWCAIS